MLLLRMRKCGRSVIPFSAHLDSVCKKKKKARPPHFLSAGSLSAIMVGKYCTVKL